MLKSYYVSEVEKALLPNDAPSQQSKEMDLYYTPTLGYSGLLEFYTMNGIHATCINFKSMITVGQGYEIVEKREREGEMGNKSRLEEFFENQENFLDTLVNVQTDFEITGNGFIEVVRNAKGEISKLYHIPCLNTLIYVIDGVRVLKQTVNSAIVDFYPLGSAVRDGCSEYLHLKNYDPKNPYYGTAEYAGALRELYLDWVAVEYNINYFQNDGIPSAVVKYYGTDVSEVTLKDIQAFFNTNFKGYANRGRVLVLSTNNPEDKIEIEKLDNSSKEAAYLGLRRDLKDNIINTHRIPKALITEIAGKLGNNQDTSMLLFKNSVIEQRQLRFEELINNHIIKQGLGIMDWEFKLKEFQVDSTKADGDYYTQMIASRIMTVNEVREKLGYPLLEELELEPNLTNVAPIKDNNQNNETNEGEEPNVEEK